MSSPGLERALGAVIRRERIAEAAGLLTRVALPSGLVIAAAAIVLARRLGTPIEAAFAAALPVVAVIGVAMLRPRSRRSAARRLDAHYGLDDRLGAALELASAPTPEDPRTAAIVGLVVAEAESLAGGLDPRPAVPLGPPGLRAHDLAAALLLGLALLVPPPAPPAASEGEGEGEAPTEAAPRPRPAPDRALLDPLRQDLRALKGKEDAAGRLAAAMLEVLEAYGRGELDREAAFAKLEALESELRAAEEALEASLEEDPAILAEGMRELAAALEQESITRPAGEDLARGEGERAAEALTKAGEEADADAAAQESLERALKAAEKALGKAASEQSDTAAELAEAERRLKKQEKEQAKEKSGDPEEDERRLKKEREKVEELRRQHEREKAAQRALEQLRRDAQEAQGRGQEGQQGQKSQQGQQGQGQQRGEGQRRALERLSRGAAGASKQSQQQRRLGQARDDLEDAKSFLRRSGQQGEGKDARQRQMERFGQAAKGKRGKDGKKGPTLLVEGEVGDGPPDMMMEGMGDEGQGGEGQESGGDDGSSQGQGDASGSSPALADGMGSGSQDPLGDATKADVRLKNVKVDPRQGRGTSRAEVIATASQEGFASADYRDVFTDYKAFAQSALDREELPPAQRRQVRRYFQLIQPRR